ncbi:DUF948 domain-containing protein [Metabacillus iocasae]
MVVLYISLAVVVGSVIYLAVAAMKAVKEMKPTVQRITATTERMQMSVEDIKRETDELTITQQKIQQDIEYKKDSFQRIIDEGKTIPQLLQQTWRSGEVHVPEQSEQTSNVERAVFQLIDKIENKRMARKN